jgi:small subunit ribosomal protein S2
VISRGERVLFVCTKKQLRPVIQSEAERSNSFHVTERWLGGMLTNFSTIKKQIRRLRELERGQEEGAFDFYTKKERLMLDREREKLEKYLVGREGHGADPGRALRRGREEGADRGERGEQAGHPGDRDRRHQRRPGPADGADRGQRRRDPLGERDRSGDRDAIIEARAAMPAEERRRADEVEATVYSSETGESAPADDDRGARSGARAASAARGRR